MYRQRKQESFLATLIGMLQMALKPGEDSESYAPLP